MFKDLSIFSALKTRMQWHQARHTVLSENVANADTPGYKGRDLKELSFNRLMASAAPRATSMTATQVARTNPKHMSGTMVDATAGFKQDTGNSFETTPQGNSVSLEEQMMNVATNQLDFNTVASVYSKSLNVLRTAVRRR